MKLLVFTGTHPFFTSSASANRLASLLKGLAALGSDVELLILGGYQKREEKEKMGTSGTYLDIRYHYLSTALLDGLWKRRYHHYIGKKIEAFFIDRKIRKLIVYTDKETIVWTTQDYHLLKLLCRVKSQYSRIRYFTEISEFLDIHHYNLGNTLQKRQGDLVQRFFENKSFYDHKGIALMTHTLLKHYQDFPGNKPRLLHLPMTVDLERFAVQHMRLNAFKQPYIVYIGVLNNAKDGIDVLLQAFAQIALMFPYLKLYLVGPWHYDTPAHLQFIQRSGLQDRIFWMGEFNREQIPAILQHAELLALPRPDSKQAQGGFPTKLGEYLASGKPVCVTTVGEIPDYLEDGESAFFAKPGSVDSFAAAMRKALSEKENALRVGVNGRKVAEKHFNKDIQAKILYDFFQELIKNDPK